MTMRGPDRIQWVPRPDVVEKMLSIQQRAEAQPCGCIGPQNGDPVCPCQMRSVRIVDGRYVRTIDLGPVPASKQCSTLLTKPAPGKIHALGG